MGQGQRRCLQGRRAGLEGGLWSGRGVLDMEGSLSTITKHHPSEFGKSVTLLNHGKLRAPAGHSSG